MTIEFEELSPIKDKAHRTVALINRIESGSYIYGLDGLRAFSILIVIAGHYLGDVFGQARWVGLLFPPAFGVNVFFVISGLLISRLLLNEYQQVGNINLRQFYLRRFLRLSPPLYLSVLVVALAYLAIRYPIDIGLFASSAIYLQNYYVVATGAYTYGMPLWSLAVEEHFYLLFPLLLLIGLRRSWRAVAGLVLFVIIASFVWRIVLAHAGVAEGAIYLRTDTRLDSLMFGVAVTIALSAPLTSRVRLILTSPVAAFAGMALVALSIVVRDPLFRETAKYSIQGLGLAAIISYAIFGTDRPSAMLRHALETPLAKYLGRLSYPLYLWHLAVFKFLQLINPQHVNANAAIGALVSLLLAMISYHVVELPMISLRRRFGSHAQA